MADQTRLRKVFERNVAAFTKRPSAAKLTGAITVRTAGGKTCEIEGDGWRFTADLPEIQGGNGEGPTPGYFASAALGACLAMGFATAFANKGVPLNGAEIRIESDFDYRGALGISTDVPVGLLPGVRLGSARTGRKREAAVGTGGRSLSCHADILPSACFSLVSCRSLCPGR